MKCAFLLLCIIHAVTLQVVAVSHIPMHMQTLFTNTFRELTLIFAPSYITAHAFSLKIIQATKYTGTELSSHFN